MLAMNGTWGGASECGWVGGRGACRARAWADVAGAAGVRMLAQRAGGEADARGERAGRKGRVLAALKDARAHRGRYSAVGGYREECQPFIPAAAATAAAAAFADGLAR